MADFLAVQQKQLQTSFNRRNLSTSISHSPYTKTAWIRWRYQNFNPKELCC